MFLVLFLDTLTLEDWPEMLSQNVTNQLPICSVYNLRRTKISTTLVMLPNAKIIHYTISTIKRRTISRKCDKQKAF